MATDDKRPGAIDDPAAFRELLAASSPAVQAITEALDALVRRVDPHVVQVVWTHQRTVGYGVGPKKSSEHYCYLAVYDRHVNLGFNEGAALDDPEHVLGGSGAKFRSLKVTEPAQADDPPLADLLRQARALRLAARTPGAPAGAPGPGTAS
jgi:hypothetical protein